MAGRSSRQPMDDVTWRRAMVPISLHPDLLYRSRRSPTRRISQRFKA